MLDAFFSSVFYSPWMLLGLVVLAIPPLIHLLNRRRYDVVDWGAMHFLKISEVTRRRLMLEELLLMLLRMALLGILVAALAGPFFTGEGTLARLTGRPNRDVVLVIDASASMSALDEEGRSPYEAARDWALAYLDDLAPSDGVAVLLAREQVVPVIETLSSDIKRVRDRLRNLPPPSGSASWPEAVKRAHAILASSQRSEREIILLGDNQKQGWADPDVLFRWELLASELGYSSPEVPGAPPRPHIWAVNLAAGRPDGKDRDSSPIPNWALSPLRGNRPVVPVDREVSFQTDLVITGQKEYSPPYKIRLEVDGKAVRDLLPPKSAKIENGKVPFSFAYKFGTPGSHLISLILEADPPREERPRGYVLKDRVPGDNRQDFSVEVLSALPVLLVDGDTSVLPPTYRGTDFLRDALSPARDRNPVVQARVVGINEFGPSLLQGEARPRVLIFQNVPRLEPAQNEAVAQFLADGGGVLVTLGERAEADAYNERLYQGGEGWLPARLDGIEGDEAKPRDAVRPDPATFTHPTLELFRKLAVGGLGEARFPRWWKLTTPGKHSAGVTVGLLRSATAAFPFFVERAARAGRVMVCAVPLDSTWATNLPDLPAFVPLAHELVYYLAGARSADFNLRPGQPIRYRLDSELPLSSFRLEPPTGEARPLSARPDEPGTYPAALMHQERGALVVYDGTRETGVWKLSVPEKGVVYYVVQPDGRESDLTPCTEEDRQKVAKMVPVTYETDRGKILEARAGEKKREDLWLYFLVGMILLLCGEVWMTRRMVKNR